MVAMAALFGFNSPSHAGGGFSARFSGYVGAESREKKCDKKSGGGSQASGTRDKPQDFATEDGTSNAGRVMLAVPRDILRKYRGCNVEIPGYGSNYVINDHCPGCEGQMKFDISFKNSDAGCAAMRQWGVKKIENVKVVCPDKRGDVSKEFVPRKPKANGGQRGRGRRSS